MFYLISHIKQNHSMTFRIHAWGDTLQESFEQCANGMYGYVTDIDYVEMNITLDIEAEGHDLESLLYNYLDELLYNFCADPYFIAKVCIIIRAYKNSLIVFISIS